MGFSKIAALLLCFSLLFFGCAQKSQNLSPKQPASLPSAPEVPAQSDKGQKPMQIPEKPCARSGSVLQNDICYLELALKESNSTYCTNIYTIEKLDSCLSYFANQSLKICEQITSKEMRSSCLLSIALREKSEETCQLIEDSQKKQACLSAILPPCMLISDESERSLCMALDKNDYSLCKDDRCLYSFALETKNEEACSALSNQSEKHLCVAEVRGSVSACLEASLQSLRDFCIERASIALNDLAGCYLASQKSQYRDNCFLSFAISRKDHSLCRQSSSESARDLCYKDFSIRTASSEACGKIIESTNKIECYFKSAKLNRMPSLCNDLWTNDLRSSCYSGAILHTLQGPLESDCKSVAFQEWRDKCYYQAARASLNSTLCTLITPNSSDRRACELLFN